MKIFNLAPGMLVLLLLLTLTADETKAEGKLLTVNDAGDSFDANPGDRICADGNGKCTLRAAIQESNACCYLNVINFVLPMPAVIDLTLGELQITRWLSIVGPGAKSLTVQRSPAQGTPNFRIFHITTSQEWRSFFAVFASKTAMPASAAGFTSKAFQKFF
jgi:CSLREA domain-containing protein